MDDEHRRALDQRKELIESRARALAETAVEASASCQGRPGLCTGLQAVMPWVASYYRDGAYVHPE